MTTQHIEEELLAGHLTGALEGDDQRFVSGHLATCDECTTRLIEVSSLLSLIPETVEDMTPRASVKTGLLAAVAQLEATTPPARATMAPESVAAPRPSGAPIVQLPTKRRRTIQIPPFALAAAILAAAVIGASGWNLIDGGGSNRDAGLIAAITGSKDNLVLPMNGTDVAPGVRAALLAPAGIDRVYVVASNVPPPPAGQAYHLYLYENGTPLKAAVLQPDANGRVSAVLDAPLARFNAMEVDIQPVGTNTPGGPAVLKSNLP